MAHWPICVQYSRSLHPKLLYLKRVIKVFIFKRKFLNVFSTDIKIDITLLQFLSFFFVIRFLRRSILSFCIKRIMIKQGRDRPHEVPLINQDPEFFDVFLPDRTSHQMVRTLSSWLFSYLYVCMQISAIVIYFALRKLF